jgi:hypothetical protein
MKNILIITLLLIQLDALAQAGDNREYMQTSKKINRYYVDLGEMNALVFEIETFFHGPQMGYTIKGIDTLARQSDGWYIGKKTKIIKKRDKLFLIREAKKKKEMSLVNVEDRAAANTQLNNAYYLDQYLKMSKAINYVYPLWDASWSRFDTWKQLSNKEIDHKAFRVYADERIKFMKDSIVEVQNRYTVLMNYLIQNVATINYISLKDSLEKLPMDYFSSYSREIVYTVAKEKPEFFFQLAEDSTPDRMLYIFNSIGNRDKEVLTKLRLVKGHADMKKAFFKDIKFRTRMPFVAAGLVLVECAAIVCLVAVIL